jgi:hypothetical protein
MHKSLKCGCKHSDLVQSETLSTQLSIEEAVVILGMVLEDSGWGRTVPRVPIALKAFNKPTMTLHK